MEIDPRKPHPERATWRVRLRFENVSDAPFRIYLPTSEPFRCGVSTLHLFVDPPEPAIFFPTPRPHGFRPTIRDVPLLAPQAVWEETQSFSLDRVEGDGAPRRIPGLEPGRRVTVRWIYRNGFQTLTVSPAAASGWRRWLLRPRRPRTLHHIWTGTLTVSADWTVPD